MQQNKTDCDVYTRKGPDPLSHSVVRLGMMSYTIRDFIASIHRVPVATDRIVGLSLVVDRGLPALWAPHNNGQLLSALPNLKVVTADRFSQTWLTEIQFQILNCLVEQTVGI